jgi:hypothetical protein
MSLYYIRPYCRMGPYICGVLTGYMLYKTKGKCRINIVSIIYFMLSIPSVCNKVCRAIRYVYNVVSNLSVSKFVGMGDCYMLRMRNPLRPFGCLQRWTPSERGRIRCLQCVAPKCLGSSSMLGHLHMRNWECRYHILVLFVCNMLILKSFGQARANRGHWSDKSIQSRDCL